MNTFKQITFTLALFWGFTACSDFKPMALGPEARLVVIADSAIYEASRPGLESTVFQIVRTVPKPEPMLEAEWQNPRQFEALKQRAYILLIASMDDTSFASRLTLSLLSDEVKELAKSKLQNIIPVRDKWRSGQLVMFVIAETADQLSSIIKKDSASFTYDWMDFTLKRTYHHMFKGHAQDDKEAATLDKLGFTVRFQHDYVIVHDSIGPNFFYVKRIQPDLDRWFWVHWWDLKTPIFPSGNQILDIQDSILRVQIQAKDSTFAEMDRRYYTQKEIDFNGFYGVETRGLWRLNDYSLGGPFINYTFYNDSLKQIFMFNGSVLAPRFPDKNVFMREMEAIAKSLRFREGKGKKPFLP